MEANAYATPALSHEILTYKATELLIKLLEDNNNVVGQRHRQALEIVMYELTEYALGKRGRVAFGLGTGLGKTTAILAWVATLVELGIEDIGISVCAFKVEELCNLKRELIKLGAPAGNIGLVHSYRHRSEIDNGYSSDFKPRGLTEKYASERSTKGNSNRQIVLASHNRVKRGDDTWGDFNNYRGQPRVLMLWDESFLKTESKVIPTLDICPDTDKFDKADKRGDLGFRDVSGLRTYLAESEAIISDAEQRRETDNNPVIVRLPSLPENSIVKFVSILQSDGRWGWLVPFVECAGQHCRVSNKSNGTLLGSWVTIPEELENVITFDASYPIRSLIQVDPSIMDADDLPQAKASGLKFGGIKSHNRVTVHHMKGRGGRKSVTKDFAGERKIVKDIIAVIKREVHPEDSVLIFTFNQRDNDIDMKDILEKRISHSNVKTKNQDEKKRIFIETWGNETSTNDFVECRHVILAGVLHQDQVRLGASYLGQVGDLEKPLTKEILTELNLSEMAHSIYQAASRGTMRVVKNGEAEPMDLWIITREVEIQQYLKKVMPGANWVNWWGCYHDGGETGRLAGKIVRELGVVLKSGKHMLDDNTHQISVTKLKRRVAPELGKDNSKFTKAVNLAVAMTTWERTSTKQSLRWSPS